MNSLVSMIQNKKNNNFGNLLNKLENKYNSKAPEYELDDEEFEKI